MKYYQIFLLICFFSCTKKDNSNISERNTDEITIGNQIWMKQNLSVTKYRNGDIIPEVKDWNEWKALKTGAWCYYNNDPSTNEKYGKLYNTAAIFDQRGLAPEGWHIPEKSEVEALLIFLGGSVTAGGKMKSTGTIEDGNGLWNSPNIATNSSGFGANPAGKRNGDIYSNTKPEFEEMGNSAYYWISFVTGDVRSGYYLNFSLGNSSNSVFFQQMNVMRNGKDGISVRCIKD